MKFPVCDNCIKSGILCPECTKKFEDKRISETDIELAALLYEMETKELIRNASFERTVIADDLLLVLTKGDVANMIGKKGRIVRQLSKRFRKTVRIIKDGDLKTKMEDLIAPARLLGINIIYKSGEQNTKLMISNEDQSKLITHKDILEKAARLLAKDNSITIEFK
ncbi:KH domain-containing protein [archaeon]|nr:KH domain-containing protein [archaeon]